MTKPLGTNTLVHEVLVYKMGPDYHGSWRYLIAYDEGGSDLPEPRSRLGLIRGGLCFNRVVLGSIFWYHTA